MGIIKKYTSIRCFSSCDLHLLEVILLDVYHLVVSFFFPSFFTAKLVFITIVMSAISRVV